MENVIKQKILVVDDDERWLRRISRILQPEYDLTLTTNHLEALETLKTDFYMLVILDMKLSEGISGLDVFSQMQEIFPNLHAIILTGYPDTGSMRSSFKKGFLDYLEKGSPNLSLELREIVKEIIENTNEFDITSLIARGESDELEFKSSLRWDIRANRLNKDLEKVIVKTIAAFMNSENESSLLIGVDDDGNIQGLQRDFSTLGKKQNRDSFENLLITLILDACGKDCIPLIKVKFYQFDGNDICQVSVKPSPKPVFVKDDKAEHFFVRTGNSTRLLTTREAMEYCKIRWGDHFS